MTQLPNYESALSEESCGFQLDRAVTTASQPNIDLSNRAEELAKELNCRYLPRMNKSLAELQAESGCAYIMILDRNGRLFMDQPELVWHPGMAVPRMRSLFEGKQDAFLDAARIQHGDKILDCTLGFASDAIIAAWAAGNQGQVLGLEASPLISAITAWGLEYQSNRYDCKKVPLSQAAKRIKVRNCFAMDFLRLQPDNRWDLVFFDPMFKAAVQSSSGMNRIRPMATYEAFDETVLSEAYRVCRKAVVLKERVFSKLFAQLDCPKIQKSKYGPIAYGIWDKK